MIGLLMVPLNDGEEPLKIVKACAKRWISVKPAVQRILEQ